MEVDEREGLFGDAVGDEGRVAGLVGREFAQFDSRAAIRSRIVGRRLCPSRALT